MTIVSMRRFSEIAVQATPRALVLVDIDDTVFSGCGNWGCAHQFAEMVKQQCAEGYTPMQAKVSVYPRWIASQSTVPTRLVDPEFPRFLETMQQQSWVFGFTARQPVIAAVTHQQLTQHGVQFSVLPDLEFARAYRKPLHADPALCAQLQLYDACESLYTRGVLYCHDLNHKGQVFQDFFATLAQYCTDRGHLVPDHVIFIDDGKHNLESMALACQDLGLRYTGFHIQSTDYPFDARLAECEARLGHVRRRSFGGSRRT